MTPDQAAFTLLHSALAARLWRYVRRAVACDMDADDIASSVWLGVWAHWATIEQPDRYAWRAAHNEVVTYRRRRGPRLVSLDAPDCRDLATPDDIEGVADALDVSAALPVLSEQELALLRIRYIHGVTSRDLGASCGVKAATIRTQSARAIRKVRQRMDVGPAA